MARYPSFLHAEYVLDVFLIGRSIDVEIGAFKPLLTTNTALYSL